MLRALKDHLIPHAGNDYRPHVLQRVAMVAMLGLVLVSFAMANLQAVLWLQVNDLISAVLPSIVVAETNGERATDALTPLTRSITLDRAAQLKAEHMAQQGYFAHYAPDGTSPWHWFRAANYPYVHAGENLAVHFNDSREVVEAWMNSPTHRANIMNGTYREIGIGVAEGEFEGYDTVFVVQLFGTPAQQPTVAAATSDSDAVTVVQERINEPATESAAQVAAAEETVTQRPATAVATPEPVAATGSPAYSLPSTTVATVAPTSTTPTPDTERFVSTSTNATPAPLATTSLADTAPTAFWGYIATSPQLLLQVIYVTLGSFVVAVLLFSMLLEFRRHQMVQVAYSAGLLVVMGGLYYLQTVVTAGVTIL